MNFKNLATTALLIATLTVSSFPLTHVLSEVPSISIPLKGVLNGRDTDIGFTDTTVTVQTVGTGKGTVLGRFSFTQIATVDFTSLTDAGVAHWVAANGDSIDVSVVGSGVPVDTPGGPAFDITETDTIIGGTGRFQGAQGSFTVTRVASADTFLTSGSFAGDLTGLGGVK